MLLPPSNLEVAQRAASRWQDGTIPTELMDDVAVEEPLQIRVDGEEVAVTLRTPGADEALALGYLLSEGVLRGVHDVGSIIRCTSPPDTGPANVVDVRSAPGGHLVADRLFEARGPVAPTASGACGRRLLGAVLRRFEPLPADAVRIPAWMVIQAVAALGEVQRGFARTGGMHAAAAYDRGGVLLAACEDIGRHNAVDKVLGLLLRRGTLARVALIAVSGRLGFEIVQKAVAARVPVLAAISAASSLAIDLGQAAGITIAGFVRGASLSVYTHPERIVGSRQGTPLTREPTAFR